MSLEQMIKRMEREEARAQKAVDKLTKEKQDILDYKKGLYYRAKNEEQRQENDAMDLRRGFKCTDWSMYPMLNPDQMAFYNAYESVRNETIKRGASENKEISNKISINGLEFEISLAKTKAESVVFCTMMRRKVILKVNGKRVSEADAYKMLEK